MKIKFIGTGSGKTSLKRNHSSILIENNNTNLLIDCGDGISKALLANQVVYNSINTIIFTHYHADHFSGIASLITQMKLNGRTSALNIFTQKDLIKPLQHFLQSCYLFEESLEFILTISSYNYDENYLIDEHLSFSAKENSHIQNRHKVKSIPESRFVSSSILIRDKDSEIIYTSDIGSREDLFLFVGINPKIFITETTHIDNDWIHGIVTFYHPEKIYLTHISDDDEQEIEKYLRNQTFPHSVEVIMAEDGQSVILS